jgi:hypothetical protein
VIIITLESKPHDGRTHWSTRTVAKEAPVTENAVFRDLARYGLQPHRQETWKLSKDPQLIEKVHDIWFLKTMRRDSPRELGVHLVLDNASSHTTSRRSAAASCSLPGSCCTSTPTSSSWINLAER